MSSATTVLDEVIVVPGRAGGRGRCFARTRPSGGVQARRGPVERDEGRTLDAVLSGVWEDLVAHRAVACPICDGAMAPRYGSGPAAVGGRCEDCQTELS